MPKAYKIDTVFRAIDKATKPVKNMQKSMTLFSKKTAKAMKISKKSVDKFDRKVKQMASNVKRNVKFMAAGLAVAGVAGVQKFAKSADDLAKTSRQIGVTVENLQSLRFAADRQGVSSDTLTKSLQKLNKNVGDLRAGTGALTTFLNKSNPALATQLKNAKSNEEAFSLLIKEIDKLPNSADKAALSQAAFGRAGQDIIKMAEIGVGGLKDLQKEFESYGGVVSTETANSAEKLIDAQTNLKAALGGVWNVVASKLIPTITKITTKINKFIKENRVLIQQKLEKVFTALGKALKFAWVFIKKTYTIFKKLKPVIIPIVAAFVAYATVMKVMAIAQGIATAAQWAMNVAMTANPVGLIIAGIAALVAGIIIFVKWVVKATKKFGFFNGVLVKIWNVVRGVSAVFKIFFRGFLGPMAIVIDFVLAFVKNLSFIKKMFTDGGIIKGIASIGLTILSALLAPLKAVLSLIGKIPGIGIPFRAAVKGIENLEESLKNKLMASIDAKVSTRDDKTQLAIQSKEGNRSGFGKGQLDVNFNNAPSGMLAAVTKKMAADIKLKTGTQPALQ